MTKKLKGYTISARIIVLGTVDLSAESLDAAMIKAKELKMEDFITTDCGLNDSSFAITGLYEDESFCI